MQVIDYIRKNNIEELEVCDSTYDVLTYAYPITAHECEEYSDRFSWWLASKLTVKSAHGNSCVADFSALVEEHADKCELFMQKFWKYSYKPGSDAYMYQWVKELKYANDGYWTETAYKNFLWMVGDTWVPASQRFRR